MREKWFGSLILERRFLMTHFRLDVSQETGAATLWMATEETACGFKDLFIGKIQNLESQLFP